MPLPLLAAGAITLGGAIGGAVMSRRSGGEKRMQREFEAATRGEKTRVDALDRTSGIMRNRYLTQLDDFDPREYANETAAAIGDEAFEQYGENEAGRAAELGRRGLYGASIGKGRVAKQYAQNLARTIGQLSMQAGAMRQRQIESYGDVYEGDRAYAERGRGNYYEMLTGSRDYHTAGRNDRNAAIMGGAGLGLRAATAFS